MLGLEFTVPSELYGQTIAVINCVEQTLNLGFAPCADGNDYFLTSHEKAQLEEAGLGGDFQPSTSLPFPLNLIAACEPVGNRLELPSAIQFNAKEYAAVKTVLINQGGKYSRNGFLFEEKGEEVYWRIIKDGDLNRKKSFQFFATPADVGAELVRLADLDNPRELKILEPSAGDGALVREIVEQAGKHSTICGYEAMPLNREKLKKIPNFKLLGEDFLQADDEKFERIIANPPFTKNQDILHIRKMYDKLAENGVLVTIASQSWQTGNSEITAAFRQFLLEVKAEIIPLKAGRFKASGTNIAACIIKIRKGEK